MRVRIAAPEKKDNDYKSVFGEDGYNHGGALTRSKPEERVR